MTAIVKPSFLSPAYYVMGKLATMISTVILPMTLIAGVYGMNFPLFPTDQWYGFWIAIGLMLLSATGAVAYFKWKRWF
jgi:magnesium transporter